MGSLQKGNKQTQWEELTDIVEEPGTYSQRNTRKKVLNIFLPTSELTRSMILLMLRVTEHSRKVCHTSITMVRLAEFSMSQSVPLVSLSTRNSGTESPQKELTSELSMSSTPNAEMIS